MKKPLTASEMADHLVTTDRQKDYGHPYDDFSRTIGMLNALGYRRQIPTGESAILEPRDLPIIMTCVKLSREINHHKEDNIVDIHGYMKCLEMVLEREKELANQAYPAVAGACEAVAIAHPAEAYPVTPPSAGTPVPRTATEVSTYTSRQPDSTIVRTTRRYDDFGRLIEEVTRQGAAINTCYSCGEDPVVGMKVKERTVSASPSYGSADEVMQPQVKRTGFLSLPCSTLSPDDIVVKRLYQEGELDAAGVAAWSKLRTAPSSTPGSAPLLHQFASARGIPAEVMWKAIAGTKATPMPA